MKSKKWKELTIKLILTTPFFRFFKKDFRRPDGVIVKDYYLMEKPESVYIVAFTKAGKIVLIKHYRPGLGDISIELPAGSVESNETPESAASRELFEETGYFAGNLSEISNFSQDTSRFIGVSCHLFLVRDLIEVEDRKLLEEDQEIEIIEVTLSEVIGMIKKGEIKDLPTIAGILLSQLFYLPSISRFAKVLSVSSLKGEEKMKEVNIGLIGCGTIGSGVVRVIYEQEFAIADKHGVVLSLRKIFTRTPCGEKSRAIYEDYPRLFVGSADEIINDPRINIVVETAGGVEFPFAVATRSISAGKHFVTANKALLAHKGQEIFDLAGEQRVKIGFEASVAGAIPIIRATSDSLVGDQIESITGILNGTTNFILTKMSQRQGDFNKILSLAQKEGFAEADPYEDISGIDARNKLVVLVRSAFGFNLNPDSIYTEGIGEIIPEDFDYAGKKLGSTIKLLAHCSRDGIAFVCPTMIPRDSFLALIDDELNGVEICGLNFKKLGFSGPGAGSRPTASSIVADIVQIAKSGRQKKVKLRKNGFDQVMPFGEVSFNHTLRFIVRDRPGIISDISSQLAKEGISIRAVEQNSYHNLPRALPFLVTLHRTEEKRVQAALDKINKLPFMVKPAHVFRSLE